MAERHGYFGLSGYLNDVLHSAILMEIDEQVLRRDDAEMLARFPDLDDGIPF